MDDRAASCRNTPARPGYSASRPDRWTWSSRTGRRRYDAVAPRFEGDPLNGYFVNDREGLVEEIGARYWISGHVHDAYQAVVGDTLVLGNPTGYPNATGRKGGLFRPDLAIEVEPAMDADA